MVSGDGQNNARQRDALRYRFTGVRGRSYRGILKIAGVCHAYCSLVFSLEQNNFVLNTLSFSFDPLCRQNQLFDRLFEFSLLRFIN
jgi:hypothetical protein